MENKGHYCYGCEEHFHDSNPNVKEHKDCKGRKEFGICVDKTEFSEFYSDNLAEKSKPELIEMVTKFQSTSVKLHTKIESLRKELFEIDKELEDDSILTLGEIDHLNFKSIELKKSLLVLEELI